MHRDFRLPDQRIGEIYDWEVLHHVHCLARSFATKAEIGPEVFGSLLLLPAKLMAGQTNSIMVTTMRDGRLYCASEMLPLLPS